MVGKQLKILFQALLVVFLSTGLRAQEPVVKAAIDKDSILIGDHVTLSLIVSEGKSHQIGFPVYKDIIVPGIELVEDLPLDTVRSEKDGVMLHKKYIITSFDSAQYHFPVTYLLQRGSVVDTLYSNELSLYVNTIPVDTTGFVMYDIKDTIQYPYTFKEALPWILLAVGVLLLIFLAVYLYMRWKKKQPIFFKPKKAEPPYVVAMRELQKLKEDKVWQQDKVKLFYSRLTDILRTYIEDAHAMQAMEKTSQEILQDIENTDLTQKYPLVKLAEMFTVADLAKFAKYTPAPDENERSYITVAEFVEATKPAETPEEQEETEEGKPVEEEQKNQ